MSSLTTEISMLILQPKKFVCQIHFMNTIMITLFILLQTFDHCYHIKSPSKTLLSRNSYILFWSTYLYQCWHRCLSFSMLNEDWMFFFLDFLIRMSARTARSVQLKSSRSIFFFVLLTLHLAAMFSKCSYE